MSGRRGSRSVWVGTTEAADLLALSARTVYRLLDDGVLPSYRFGRVVRLKRVDVEAFVEACRIEPGTLQHLYQPERTFT